MQAVPEDTRSQHPHTQIPIRDKGKGKGKAKTTESPMASGSGSQVCKIIPKIYFCSTHTRAYWQAIHNALGQMSISPSTPGEMTPLCKLNWSDVLTSDSMYGWTLAEQDAMIDEEEMIQGEQSWAGFVNRAPTRPS